MALEEIEGVDPVAHCQILIGVTVQKILIAACLGRTVLLTILQRAVIQIPVAALKTC